MPAPAPTWGKGSVLSLAQVKTATGYSGALTQVGTGAVSGAKSVMIGTKSVSVSQWQSTFVDYAASMYPQGSSVTKFSTTLNAQNYYKAAYDAPTMPGAPARVTALGGKTTASGVLLYTGQQYMVQWAQGWAWSGTIVATASCTLGSSNLDAQMNPKAMSTATRNALVACASKLAKAQVAWATNGRLQ